MVVDLEDGVRDDSSGLGNWCALCVSFDDLGEPSGLLVEIRAARAWQAARDHRVLVPRYGFQEAAAMIRQVQ